MATPLLGLNYHHRLLRHTAAKQNTKHAQTSLKNTDKTQ